MNAGSYSVTVIDNFHRTDPADRHVVTGFRSAAEADAYAVCRVRSSIEQFRKAAKDKADLWTRWTALGEEVVVAGRYIGMSNFDEFAENPADEQECDYRALQPVNAGGSGGPHRHRGR